jgi:hypothetical protein
MTTADDARKEAAFLYWRMPKNKQPQVPQELAEGQGGVIDDTHITITALDVTAANMLRNDPHGDRLMTTYTEDGELSNKEFKMIDIDTDLGVFTVDREKLLKLLTPMTSDYVSLRFSGRGGVWIIAGMIGEKIAAAYLAPRVEQ